MFHVSPGSQETKGPVNPKLSDTMIWYLMFVMLLSELPDKQDKRMDELNLFIDYHAKYIVSII